MKRPQQARLAGLCKCNPWFIWRTCTKCHSEFKRENGWVYLQSFRTLGYLCQECGPTYEAARDYFSTMFPLQLIEGRTRKGGLNTPPSTPRPDVLIMPQKPKNKSI